MASRFIGLGHTVLGCARSKAGIEKLRRQHGSPHHFQTVDVALEAQVKTWAGGLIKRHGPPDILVNNAAIINANAPLWKVGGREFSAVIDVNIKGTANTIRHFVPAMNERGSGVIVNFSSGWGRSVDAEVAPYCATKFAIEGLTRALAIELPSGLAAIALNPGIIDTAMLQSCFGGSSAGYETPESWAKRAVPFLLRLGPADNGGSLTVPE
jgi:NAD(P)-dependent dehydrogenase (short-subunit alcohol dehydrogenase family)